MEAEMSLLPSVISSSTLIYIKPSNRTDRSYVHCSTGRTIELPFHTSDIEVGCAFSLPCFAVICKSISCKGLIPRPKYPTKYSK